MADSPRDRMERAKQYGDVLPNGVAFECWPDGVGFELFREPHHTDADIEAARNRIWLDQKIGIKVTTVPPPTTAKAKPAPRARRS